MKINLEKTGLPFSLKINTCLTRLLSKFICISAVASSLSSSVLLVTVFGIESLSSSIKTEFDASSIPI